MRLGRRGMEGRISTTTSGPCVEFLGILSVLIFLRLVSGVPYDVTPAASGLAS